MLFVRFTRDVRSTRGFIATTLLPNHLEPTRTGDPRIRADQRNAERDGGAGDQAVERVTKRRKGPRLDHVPSLQGQEEKCRITLDRVAPFVERGSQADPPAFLELSHLEKADRGHGNPDPTRFGTTDEAAGLSTEGLLDAAQVEDQRRRVENGTGLTHGVDGESAPNERCDARGSRRTRAGALGWSEGARRECRAAGRCRADRQAAVPAQPVSPTRVDAAPTGRLAVRGASARPPDRCGAPRRRFGRGRGARRRSKCSSPFEHWKCTLRFPPSATRIADERRREPPTSSP